MRVSFVVCLYQRWVYRVDMTRVNEFGHRGDGGDGAKDGDGASGKAKEKESKKRR